MTTGSPGGAGAEYSKLRRSAMLAAVQERHAEFCTGSRKKSHLRRGFLSVTKIPLRYDFFALNTKLKNKSEKSIWLKITESFLIPGSLNLTWMPLPTWTPVLLILMTVTSAGRIQTGRQQLGFTALAS